MSSVTGYLLDTGIVIELMKGTDLGRHVNQKFGLTVLLSRNIISVVTVGEALAAASMMNWGRQKQDRLWELLEELEWIDINDRTILGPTRQLITTAVKKS
jgi:predicted nucleic acid-binding protein